MSAGATSISGHLVERPADVTAAQQLLHPQVSTILKLNRGNLIALLDNRGFLTWARLASSPLSTFPQPRSSTASQRLTSLFSESIHRAIHRTLAFAPPGLA